MGLRLVHVLGCRLGLVFTCASCSAIWFPAALSCLSPVAGGTTYIFKLIVEAAAVLQIMGQKLVALQPHLFGTPGAVCKLSIDGSQLLVCR